MMLIPPALTQGDEVRIISTARKITEIELEPAKLYLEQAGFKVTYGNNLFGSFNQFSGSDIERANDLQSAINQPNVKAILCARGGYGTVRLLKLVNFNPLKDNPKWIAGYSDVTALHCHLQMQVGISSLHSTMPINFSNNTKDSLLSLVNGFKALGSPITFKTHPLQVNGEVTGTLLGGNLSVLYSLLGSPDFPNVKNAILFFEDLDEYLYHIDRMMQAFDRTQIFKNIAGVLVGGLTDMNDNTIPFGFSAEEIVKQTLEPYKIPVAFGFPAGHIDDNRTLILGSTVTLKINNLENSLTYGSTQRIRQ
jgi:muramoyltetrapeptide carboxypeptidase